MRRKIDFASLVLLILAACPPTPLPTKPPSTEAAPAACAKFQELGCRDIENRPLWEPTPGGATCVEVFEKAAAEGVDLGPACIAAIKSCDERNACTSAAGK